jgi:hypothetical protein
MRASKASGLLAIALLVCAHAQAADIELTPLSNKGGQLPSGYDLVAFTTTDGNWTPDILLPVNPVNGQRVRIVANATYSSVIDTARSNLNLPKLAIHTGDSIEFVYEGSARQWRAAGASVANMSPSATGTKIPEAHGRISVYDLSPGNWTAMVTLPVAGRDGDVIAINSSSPQLARIDPTNALFAATMSLGAGDHYAFVYNGDFNKWVMRTTPDAQWKPASVLRRPIKAHTFVEVTDANWVRRIRLPARAGDRDRITLRSTAAAEVTISNAYTASDAITRLYPGAEYTYVYTADYQVWERVASPVVKWSGKDVSGGNLPRLRTPVTVLTLDDATAVDRVGLPATYGNDTRVVIQAPANRGLEVKTGRGWQRVLPNELVAYTSSLFGRWRRETATIDVLLLYSDVVAKTLGDSAARARMYESFHLTNQALENSGANFRYRLAGLRSFATPDTWKTLNDAVDKLRTDERAQAMLAELKADGIYYEGAEQGCGLAWVHASRTNMVATGSTACGTTVMRHEMGHNMGLQHGGTEGAGVAQGYLPVRSIMAGNAIPYYATPWQLTEDGIRMGVPGKFDAVTAMNARSREVSAYR